MKYFLYIVLGLISWQCLASNIERYDTTLNVKVSNIKYPGIGIINEIMREVPGEFRLKSNSLSLSKLHNNERGYLNKDIKLLEDNNNSWHCTFTSSQTQLSKCVYEKFVDQTWDLINNNIITHSDGTRSFVVEYSTIHPIQKAQFKITFSRKLNDNDFEEAIIKN